MWKYLLIEEGYKTDITANRKLRMLFCVERICRKSAGRTESPRSQSERSQTPARRMSLARTGWIEFPVGRILPFPELANWRCADAGICLLARVALADKVKQHLSLLSDAPLWLLLTRWIAAKEGMVRIAIVRLGMPAAQQLVVNHLWRFTFVERADVGKGCDHCRHRDRPGLSDPGQIFLCWCSGWERSGFWSRRTLRDLQSRPLTKDYLPPEPSHHQEYYCGRHCLTDVLRPPAEESLDIFPCIHRLFLRSDRHTTSKYIKTTFFSLLQA